MTPGRSRALRLRRDARRAAGGPGARRGHRKRFGRERARRVRCEHREAGRGPGRTRQAADEKTADADEKEALKVRWSLTSLGQYDWIDRDHDDNDDVTGVLRSVRVRSEQVERLSVPDRRERGLARPARRGGHAAPDVPAREPDLQPRRLGLADRRPVLQPARAAPRPPAGLRPRPALPAHAHRGHARVPEHRRRRPALRRPERSSPALRCGADRLRRGAARAHGRAARLRGLAAPDRRARAVAARRLRGAQGRPPAPLPDRPHEPVDRARAGPRPGGGRRGGGLLLAPRRLFTLDFDFDYQSFRENESTILQSALGGGVPPTDNTIDFIPDTDRYTGSARFRSQPRGAGRARGRDSSSPCSSRRTISRPTEDTAGLRDNRLYYYSANLTADANLVGAFSANGYFKFDERDNDIERNTRCSRTTTAARWTSSSTAGDACRPASRASTASTRAIAWRSAGATTSSTATATSRSRTVR